MRKPRRDTRAGLELSFRVHRTSSAAMMSLAAAPFQRLFAFLSGLARCVGTNVRTKILVRRLVGRPFTTREAAFFRHITLLLRKRCLHVPIAIGLGYRGLQRECASTSKHRKNCVPPNSRHCLHLAVLFWGTLGHLAPNDPPYSVGLGMTFPTRPAWAQPYAFRNEPLLNTAHGRPSVD